MSTELAVPSKIKRVNQVKTDTPWDRSIEKYIKLMNTDKRGTYVMYFSRATAVNEWMSLFRTLAAMKIAE